MNFTFLNVPLGSSQGIYSKIKIFTYKYTSINKYESSSEFFFDIQFLSLIYNLYYSS